jgi:hypothetical protein
MVSRSASFPTLFLALQLAALPLLARDYEIGEQADQEIRTPTPMVVIDAEATEQLKEKEGRRVAVIYRYIPGTVDDVTSAFHSTFIQTQVNFLAALETRFKTRTLTEAELESGDFQRFVTQFQKQNILFPVDTTLAASWARGEDGRETEEMLLERLRAPLKGYVRPDTGPSDIWVGATIRIVSLAANETASATLVNERGFNLAKTNFISAQRVKTDLIASFPTEQRAVARYVASFIRPNCLMEEELTRTLRGQRTAGLVAADRYAAGDVIVRPGQVVDKRIKAALDQLNERTAAAQFTQLESMSQPLPVEPRKSWLWPAALAAAALLIFFGAVKLARRRVETSLLPAVPERDLLTAPASTALSTEENWRQRALLAEQRVQKVQAEVRSGLMRQLADWMSSKLTRKLASQRDRLMDAHQKAAQEMAELESRLEKVQAPLQERLLAYEQRIVELEKELAVKGEENRELIRAKIQMVRKQLELEREKTRVEFN